MGSRIKSLRRFLSECCYTGIPLPGSVSQIPTLLRDVKVSADSTKRSLKVACDAANSLCKPVYDFNGVPIPRSGYGGYGYGGNYYQYTPRPQPVYASPIMDSKAAMMAAARAGVPAGGLMDPLVGMADIAQGVADVAVATAEG